MNLAIEDELKKKILIVDDDPKIVKLISMRLMTKGYEVFVSNDGVDCVKIAQREVPDLILLDIMMPHRGGLHAFEKLLQLDITRSIPVIFMTAYPKAEIKTQVMKMGANGHISKPFTSAEIEQTIQNILS